MDLLVSNYKKMHSMLLVSYYENNDKHDQYYQSKDALFFTS
jgi:hypothetical protein